MAELLDRVAVVTGAAGVVGAAVAQRFAEEGARIVLVDDDAAALARVREMLRRSDESVDSQAADLSSERQVTPLLARTLARFGRIDILVNAMGTAEEPPWDEPGPAAWERRLRSLTACMLCARPSRPRCAGKAGDAS